MSWFKKSKKVELEKTESEVYNDPKSSEYDKFMASVRVATNHWNRMGYNGTAVDDKYITDEFIKYVNNNNGNFQGSGVYDAENGIYATMINEEGFNLLVNFLFKDEVRDQKLKDLGI